MSPGGETGMKRGREGLKKNAGSINSEKFRCREDGAWHPLDRCCVSGTEPQASPPCVTPSPHEQNLQDGP